MIQLFRYKIKFLHGKIFESRKIFPVTVNKCGYVLIGEVYEFSGGGTLPVEVLYVDIGETHRFNRHPRDMEFWGYEIHDGSPSSYIKQEALVIQLRQDLQKAAIAHLRTTISDVGLVSFDGQGKLLEEVLTNQLNLMFPEEKTVETKDYYEDDFINCE